jgi:secreted PhoX family phosphatase
MNKLIALFSLLFLATIGYSQQTIGTFTSIEPLPEGTDFIIPSSHVFQKIIEAGDSLYDGTVLMEKNDFTGYVPISESSENGYLSINSELVPGGASVLDINFNTISKLWETTYGKQIDFTPVVSTTKNCSGAVTPWGTIISCEEIHNSEDLNNNGYHDLGWGVEIDPVNKVVINKLWALGKMKHENMTIHTNQKTVYEGADANPGYLLKFVADTAQNLNSGSLYVYKGEKNGTGNWLLINNSAPAECNTTNQQCAALNATGFNGIEDVEVGPDGWVYFAVKGEDQVYRFIDVDPLNGTLVSTMETFVGNMDYTINYNGGSKTIPWGYGNDNLAFDGGSNLWVLQDGGNNHIWVVGKNHTQQNPNVRIFANVPIASEPTGITFSPDYRFLFMSIQSPDLANNETYQLDAAGNYIGFDKSITLVIAREENLGNNTSISTVVRKNDFTIAPNPVTNYVTIQFSEPFVGSSFIITNAIGEQVFNQVINQYQQKIDVSKYTTGLYFISLKDNEGTNIASKRFLKM